MVSGQQWLPPWLVRGANCGSRSGTPNLDICCQDIAVKADVVSRTGVVRAMIQEVDVLVNEARLSCVAVT